MEVKAEYLAIFSEEAVDQLRDWEECLLALEKSPEDREPLNGMFRAIHTLKGSAGFIGFDTLQKVAHDLESSLSEVRDGSRLLEGSLSELLFKGLDLCKTMIDAFTSGKTTDVDVEGFLGRLAALAASNTSDPTALPAVVSVPVATPAAEIGTRTSLLRVTIQGQNREAYMRSFIVKARLEKLGKVLSMEPSPDTLRDSNDPFVYTVSIAAVPDAEALATSISIDQVTVAPVTPSPEAPKAEDTDGAASAAAREAHEQFSQSSRPDEVVRVSVQKLDALLNLVGELVIHNSGFIAATQVLKEEYGKARFIYDLEEKTEVLSAITRELQDGIMKARMLPIANVFNRFRRVVRDLAKTSGKSVILDVFGEETEIDKKVIDRIGEPLVHLVRNAVDHGLEPSAERVAAGKTATGTIRLGAFQEGDHICIEISDDGKGLDRDAILRKALEKGLISSDEAPRASAEQILNFIFLPGFSTALTVTDISGRGVGMDAVKRAVDEMNGNLRVRSTPCVGTTIIISLPLTMAIITAVLVEVSGSTFAVPLSAVREILKSSDSILRTVGSRNVILLRGEVLALVNLAYALHGGRTSEETRPQPGNPVVVVDFEGRKIGIEVEKIIGTREVVIKSLSRHYREVDGLIGASILGNGKIALIVDVETLISRHHQASDGSSEVGRPPLVEAERQGATSRAEPPAAQVASSVQAVEQAEPASAPSAEPVRPPEVEAEELAKIVSGAKGRLLEDVNNQGAIQASISLSQLTGNEIRVSFPESRLVAIKDIADFMGGEECTVAGMYVGIQGELSAGMLLVIPEANLLMIDDLLHGRPRGTTTKTSEVDLSGISEMGNILSSCFINAMADATRLALAPEVPEISIDMCLPVIDSVLARFNQSGDRILLTETVIYGEGMDNVVCHQILFLEPDSLRTLIDALAAPQPRQERKPAPVAG
jgi:two-component system chemotaxis sensor kinase CheA